MSRELKFRAWDKRIAGMWTPILDRDGCPCARHPISQQLVRMDGDLLDPVMQYIGHKDRNETEVYEGDILDIHQTVNGCNIFVVEWNKLGWTVRYGANMNTPRLYEYDIDSFFAPCEYSGEADYEVVGNIHENPELLQGE